jgi:8-oxo-dGDP phosphatase
VFRKLDERELHRWHVGRLVELDFVSDDGEHFGRTIVRTNGAVSVVPVFYDSAGVAHVYLLRQWRPSMERVLWEVPAGMRDKPGEDPAETGRRELIEEIGYEAGALELLTIFHPSAGMTDGTHHVYLATDLRHVGAEADGPEEREMEVVAMPFTDALGLVRSGEIMASSAVIGLLLAADRIADLPPVS